MRSLRQQTSGGRSIPRQNQGKNTMVRLREKGRPIHSISPARHPAAKDRARISHFPRFSLQSSAPPGSQKHRLSRYHSTHQGVCQEVCPRSTAVPWQSRYSGSIRRNCRRHPVLSLRKRPDKKANRGIWNR